MMRRKLSLAVLAFFIIYGVAGTGSVLAEDARSKASAAVTGILFDYNASDFSSYIVNEDGSLDFTFASNTPDAIYSEILNALQKNPDIKGVLAGKNGPTCSSF